MRSPAAPAASLFFFFSRWAALLSRRSPGERPARPQTMKSDRARPANPVFGNR